jgi:hypothetical protein
MNAQLPLIDPELEWLLQHRRYTNYEPIVCLKPIDRGVLHLAVYNS